MKIFISLIILLFLLHWQANAQQPFSGKITDQATQQPIANVTVSVNQTAQSVLTDSLGNFKLMLPKV